MKNNLTLGLLSTLSIIIAAASLITIVNAQENQIASDMPKFFAIQHAQSGSLSEINETAYSLELNDVSDKTILFSDRPDRIVKSVNTTDFIGNWSVGEDSFAVDPPNVMLVVDEIGEQDIVLAELFNPVYDSEKKILNYDVIPDNATSIELPNKLLETTLVIDSYGGAGGDGGAGGLLFGDGGDGGSGSTP